MKDMTVKERETITETLISIEQYVCTLFYTATNPGIPLAALEAARDNLITKVAEFVKQADQ